jgi:hypothetical protein
LDYFLLFSEPGFRADAIAIGLTKVCLPGVDKGSVSGEVGPLNNLERRTCWYVLACDLSEGDGAVWHRNDESKTIVVLGVKNDGVSHLDHRKTEANM